MAKRNNASTPAPAPKGFAADAKAPVVGEKPATPSPDNSEGANDDDAMGDVPWSEIPDPLGICGVYWAGVAPAGASGKFIISLCLEAEIFESLEPLQVWIDPSNRQDQHRCRQICIAFGINWDAQRHKPEGGWDMLKGKRARAVMVPWEKTKSKEDTTPTGDVDFQLMKFPPKFSNTPAGLELRDRFVQSCADTGVACEMKQQDKGKWCDWWNAKGPSFSTCGILPVSSD